MRNVRAPSAPRIIKLPASILSGIVVYVFPRAERSFPPFIAMVVVPAPLMFAPHCTFKKNGRPHNLEGGVFCATDRNGASKFSFAPEPAYEKFVVCQWRVS